MIQPHLSKFPEAKLVIVMQQIGLPIILDCQPILKARSPLIRKYDNVIFDIEFYIGLDEWLDGLYFRIHAPVVNTRWNLNFKEDVIKPA